MSINTAFNNAYANATAEDAVAAAYENLLGYDSAQNMENAQERMQYWQDRLESGDLPMDNFASTFVDESDGGDSDYVSDEDLAANGAAKQAVQGLGDDVEDLQTIADSAKQAADQAREDDQQDDGGDEGEGEPGETLSLTESDDLVSPDGADYANEDETVTADDFDNVLTATADNDTIEGVASSLSSERTLASGDRLYGGEGNDTLSVDMQGNFNGFSGNGGLWNVETVELTNEGSIGRTFNAGGSEGVESFVLNAGEAGVNLSGLDAAGKSVTVNDQAAGNLDIDHADGVTDATDDAIALSLNNVGTVDNPDTDDNEREAVTTNIAGIEELSLDVSGDNVIELGEDDAANITAAGGGTLQLDDVGQGAETFNAADVTGDVAVNVGQASNMTSVVTGEGDDAITVADVSDDLRSNAELNGGDGQDTLSLSGNATVQYNMAGIENVDLGALGGKLTFSAKNATGIEQVNVTDNQDDEAVFDSMGNGDLTFGLQGNNSGNAAAVTSDHGGTTTIHAMASADADKDNTEANDADVTASGSNAVILNVDEFQSYEGTISASKAQSIDATIDGGVDTTINAGAATSGVFNTNGDEKATVDLQAAKMADLQANTGGDFDMTASDMSGLQSLTAESAGHIETGDLTAVNQVSLAGSGQATVGDLGATDQDYGLTVTAEGLGDGLTLGDNSNGLSVGAGQKVSVNVANVLGAVTLNNGVSVADDGNGDKSGTISIDADGASEDVDLTGDSGQLEAKTVEVYADGALGAMDADIVGQDVTVEGAGLETNTLNVTASGSVAIDGGIGDDSITLTDGLNDKDDKLSGHIDGDLGSDTLTADNALDLSEVSVSNIATLDTNGGDVTMKAADVSETALDLDGGNTLTLVGTDGTDTIDLSNMTITSGDIEVSGSDGQDTITASKGDDTFTYTAESQFGDTIKGFASGTDKVNLDVGGTTGQTVTTGNGSNSYVSMNGLFTAAAVNGLATGSAKTINVLSSASAAITASGALSVADYIGTDLSSVTEFLTAVNSFTGVTATGDVSNFTGTSHVILGHGSNGEIWAVNVTSSAFNLTGTGNGTSSSATLTGFSDGDVSLIADADGIDAADVVLV